MKDRIISVVLCIQLVVLLVAIYHGYVERDGFIAGALSGFTVYHIAQVFNKHLYGK
jgi:hypothetical protein